MTPTLTQQCLMLSDTEKKKLISKLYQSMEQEPVDDGSRFNTLYKAAKEICGNGIMTNSRLSDSVLGRKLIVYQMRLEGFTLKTIAKALHRNHTSILHLQKEMQNAIDYPRLFQKEIKYWNLFQDKIKEQQHEKELGS